DAARAIPRADDRGDPRGAPEDSSVRHGRRQAWRGRTQLGRANRRLAYRSRIRGRDANEDRRHLRDRDAGRRRLRHGVRRRLLLGIGLAALAPRAFAQEAGKRRLGFLAVTPIDFFLRGNGTPNGRKEVLSTLAELGFVVGRNLELEERWNVDIDKLP